MVVKQYNIRQFVNFTKAFPKEMEKIGVSLNNVLAKSMQTRIRRRAVGRLKKIKVISRGKKLVRLEFPNNETGKIARYVNAGMYPKHPIPAQLMEASRAGVETAGKKTKNVLGQLDNPTFVSPGPSPAKGFITNSQESLKRDLPKIIEEKIQDGFNKM